MLFFALCLARHRALDDIDQLERGLDRFLFALALDRRSDQRRIALFAVFKQDAADLLPAPAVDHVVRGQLLRPVHAHVERRVLHVGKAALGMVQLRRGYAEVEQDAVRARKAEAFEHLVDLAEVALDRGHPLPDILQADLGVFKRLVVPVDADQPAAIMQTLRNAERMSGTAGRRVDINAVRFDLKRRKARVEQDGYMMKFHTGLLPQKSKVNVLHVGGNALRVDRLVVDAPFFAVPDLGMVELADHDDIFFQVREFAQACRDEDTALCVQLRVERIGKVVPLDAARLLAVAQTADTVLERLPLFFGVNSKAAVQALGDGEALAQLFAQSGRHSQTPFGVNGMLVFALHRIHTTLSLWWNL